MTSDDAGKPVVLLNPVGFCDWPLRGDDRIDLLVRRVGVGAFASWRAVAAWVVVAAVASALAVVFMLTLRAIWPGQPGWAYVVALSVVASTVARLGWRWRLIHKRAGAKRMLLADGLCASCGYNLHGLLLEGPQRHVVCPECAAEWNRSRIVRTEDFAAGSSYGNPLVSIAHAESTGTWATRDDRGERLALVHPRLVRLWARGRGSAAWAAKLRGARRRIAGENALVRTPVVLAAWLLLLSVAAFIVGLWFDPANRGMAFVLGASGALVVFATLALWATYGNFLYSVRSVRRAMLEHCMCPSCATELPPGSSETDDCVLCPCCHAAWRCTPPATGPGAQAA